MYTSLFEVDYTLGISTLLIVMIFLNNDVIDILENNRVDLPKYSFPLIVKSMHFRSRSNIW